MIHDTRFMKKGNTWLILHVEYGYAAHAMNLPYDFPCPHQFHTEFPEFSFPWDGGFVHLPGLCGKGGHAFQEDLPMKDLEPDCRLLFKWGVPLHPPISSCIYLLNMPITWDITQFMKTTYHSVL